MKFKILVPQEIYIHAELVEGIFLQGCEDFHDGDKTVEQHTVDILTRADFQGLIALPDGYTFDETEENHITLRQIKAAKKKESK